MTRLLVENLHHRLREWIARRRTPAPALTRRFIGRAKYAISIAAEPQKARATWDDAIAVWFARKDDPSL
jgi:hypothetical protein